MQKNTQSGYVGLIALLLTTAIIGFWYLQSLQVTEDVSLIDQSLQPNNADGTVPTTQHELNRANTDAANAAKDLIDSHNKDLEDALQF